MAPKAERHRSFPDISISSIALEPYLTPRVYAQWLKKYPYSDATERFIIKRGVSPTRDKIEAYRMLEDRVHRLKQLTEKIAVLIMAILAVVTAR